MGMVIGDWGSEWGFFFPKTNNKKFKKYFYQINKN
jgi:hypothetical protein